MRGKDLGWYGPRGLASILFALIVVEGGNLSGASRIEAVVGLTVGLSTLLHGASAWPLSRRYGRPCLARRDRARAEHEVVTEMSVRIRSGAPDRPFPEEEA